MSQIDADEYICINKNLKEALAAESCASDSNCDKENEGV
jgi:hypothetical protein